MISIVIPAYNEAPRIVGVLDTVTALPSPAEVIVVDDGSTDDTRAVAGRYPVQVIRLPRNAGKGAAMAAGVLAAHGQTIAFLDADLRGLRPVHVWRLTHPVDAGWSSMVVGQMAVPQLAALYTSGQRATTRVIAMDAVQHGLATAGYGADAMLLRSAKGHGGPIHVVVLDGVAHAQKAAKWGPEGLARTLGMPIEVLRWM